MEKIPSIIPGAGRGRASMVVSCSPDRPLVSTPRRHQAGDPRCSPGLRPPFLFVLAHLFLHLKRAAQAFSLCHWANVPSIPRLGGAFQTLALFCLEEMSRWQAALACPQMLECSSGCVLERLHMLGRRSTLTLSRDREGQSRPIPLDLFSRAQRAGQCSYNADEHGPH